MISGEQYQIYGGLVYFTQLLNFNESLLIKQQIKYGNELIIMNDGLLKLIQDNEQGYNQQQYNCYCSPCSPQTFLILKNPYTIVKQIIGQITIVFFKSLTFDPTLLLFTQQFQSQSNLKQFNILVCEINELLLLFNQKPKCKSTIFVITENQNILFQTLLQTIQFESDQRIIRYMSIQTILNKDVSKFEISNSQIVKVLKIIRDEYQLQQFQMNNWLLKNSEKAKVYNACIKAMVNQQYNYRDSMKLCQQFAKVFCEHKKQHMLYHTMHYFFRDYDAKKLDDYILKDYTSQTFLYKFINTFLRISSDPTQLFWIQPLVSILYRKIKQLYEETKNIKCIFYRGVQFSRQQISFFEQNVNGIIENLGFLSVSESKQIAQQFAGNALIQIHVSEIKNKCSICDHGFARINQLSYHEHQKQTLFNVSNCFLIKQFSPAKNNIQYLIQLHYSCDSPNLCQKYGNFKQLDQGSCLQYLAKKQKQQPFRWRSIFKKYQLQKQKIRLKLISISDQYKKYQNYKQNCDPNFFYELGYKKQYKNFNFCKFQTYIDSKKLQSLNQREYNLSYKLKQSASLAMITKPSIICELMNKQYDKIIFLIDQPDKRKSQLFQSTVKSIKQLKQRLFEKQFKIVGCFSLNALTQILKQIDTDNFQLNKIIYFQLRQQTKFCIKQIQDTNKKFQQIQQNTDIKIQKIVVNNILQVKYCPQQYVKEGFSFFFDVYTQSIQQVTTFQFVIKIIIDQQFQLMELFQNFVQVSNQFKSNKKQNYPQDKQYYKNIYSKYREQNYQQSNQHQFLKIYTGENNFYKLLNLTRLTASPSDLLSIQPIYKNIYNSINQIFYEESPLYQKAFTCYRGAFLRKDQIHKIIQKRGTCIKTRCFLSCTLEKAIAKMFEINVLFQILVPDHKRPNKKKQNYPMYAGLRRFSQFDIQMEIIFNPLSLFEIQEIKKYQQYGQQKYKIILKYCPIYEFTIKIKSMSQQLIILSQNFPNSLVYFKVMQGLKQKRKKQVWSQGQIYLNIGYGKQNYYLLQQGMRYWSYRVDLSINSFENTPFFQGDGKQITHIYQIFYSLNSLFSLILKQDSMLQRLFEVVQKIQKQIKMQQMMRTILYQYKIKTNLQKMRKLKIIYQLLKYSLSLISNTLYLKDRYSEIPCTTHINIIQQQIQQYYGLLQNCKGIEQKIVIDSISYMLMRYNLSKILLMDNQNLQTIREFKNRNKMRQKWGTIHSQYIKQQIKLQTFIFFIQESKVRESQQLKSEVSQKQTKIIKIDRHKYIFERSTDNLVNANNVNASANGCVNVSDCGGEGVDNRDTENTSKQDQSGSEWGRNLIEYIGHANMIIAIDYLSIMVQHCLANRNTNKISNRDKQLQAQMLGQQNRIYAMYQHVKVWFNQQFDYNLITCILPTLHSTLPAQFQIFKTDIQSNYQFKQQTSTTSNRESKVSNKHHLQHKHIRLCKNINSIGALKQNNIWVDILQPNNHNNQTQFVKKSEQIINTFIDQQLGTIHNQYNNKQWSTAKMRESALMAVLNDNTQYIQAMLDRLKQQIRGTQNNEDMIQNIRNILIGIVTVRFLIEYSKSYACQHQQEIRDYFI